MKPTLRDLPNTPVDQPSNPLAQYIESLPEKRGFFDGPGLDPSNPKDAPMLDQLINATVQGTLNEDHVKKIMARNERAAPLFANALTTQKAYKEKSGKIQSVLSENFRPDGNVITGGEDDQMVRYQSGKRDFESAITRLNGMGENERAKQLAEQYKTLQEATGANKQDKNINSYSLALRAEGLRTDDERVNKLTAEQAKNALARTMPPTVVVTTGGSIVAPRGDVPGKPGALPNFVPNPKDLSPEAIKELSEVTATAEQSRNLLAGFKDDFGGYKSAAIGDAVVAYQSRFGDDEALAGWWNEYQAKKNVTRSKLFGSALTATEKGEWEKADVNPGMKPSLIRKNLARRAEVEQKAAAKLKRAYQSGSYNKQQVEAATATSPEPKPRVKFSELP